MKRTRKTPDRFVYDKTDIHRDYDKARKLPDATVRMWLDRIEVHCGESKIGRILDVGCGTGRFSTALSNRFGARVYALDPSRKMLSIARSRISPGVSLIAGDAERLPVRSSSMDIIFLSMVFHHIRNRPVACDEFARILQPGGTLVVRTATKETLRTYLWLTFFPAAQAIEYARVPSRASLVNTVSQAGFRLAADEVVTQRRYAKNLLEYRRQIGVRALSSLKEISDEEFGAGLRAMDEYSDSTKHPAIDKDVDLFVFRKSR